MQVTLGQLQDLCERQSGICIDEMGLCSPDEAVKEVLNFLRIIDAFKENFLKEDSVIEVNAQLCDRGPDVWSSIHSSLCPEFENDESSRGIYIYGSSGVTKMLSRAQQSTPLTGKMRMPVKLRPLPL